MFDSLCSGPRMIPLLVIGLMATACVNTDSSDASDSAGGSGSVDTDGSGGMGVADEMAAVMAMGVNIGNTLDNTTTWETGWGQPRITQTYVDGLASHGIKTVRVPVAWDTYAVDGVIASDKMARVHEVVQWIVDAGMYAIVDIHWDNGWINNESNDNAGTLTDDVRSKFAAYWTQISTAFADVGEHLIFEAMNEEGIFYVNGDSSTPDYAPLNELNQTFVTTVRQGGGYNTTRSLLISGFGTDIDKTCVVDFAIPDDPAGTGRLFLSIHYYEPSTFCIQEAPANYWGDEWTYPSTTWGSADEQATLSTKFNKLASFSNARGIPIIIGEFSVTFGKEPYVRESASRILWMKSVASAAIGRSMVPVLWDTGGDVDRSDGSLSSDFQTVMTELGL